MLRRANLRSCLLVLLSLSGLYGLNSPAVAADQNKPVMTIIMERGELLAGQAIALHVWIENPTDMPMTDIRFHYSGPDFLKIGIDPLDGGACVVTKSGEIFVKSVQPRSTLDPPLSLCLRAESAVSEYDLSLGFSVTYRVIKDGLPTSSVLVDEKKLSVGLFGTENIGGVSLRLAAYVVPGLLFMMILRLGGFPGVKVIESVEVATLSVLVSVFLFFVAASVPWFKLTFAGIDSAVSARLFLALCVAAIVIGGLMDGVCWLIRTCRAHKQRALQVQTTDKDNDAAAFRKALKGAGDDLRPITIIDRHTQEKFVGSLMAPTGSGGTALVGWFELQPPSNEELSKKLTQLVNGKQLLRALDLAGKNKILPRMRNPIRTLSADGTLGYTVDSVKRFSAEDILEPSRSDFAELEGELPLMMATP